MSQTIHRAGSAVACLFVAGTFSHANAQTVRYRDAAGREVERHCQPAEWPKQLPALEDVVDSAALLAALQAAPRNDSSDIVLSVLFRNDGTASARVIEPDAGHSALLEVVGRGVRALRPKKAAGAVRVRVRTAGAVTATVERSIYCPPESPPGGDGLGGVRTAIVSANPGDVLPRPGQTIRVDAELSIDEAGQVTGVRLMTRSGMRDLDESFVRDQWERVFLPALLDGRPIASWLRTGGAKMRL